ncbi:response regulator transcription factor [Chlorobaculum sp. 24CR]|nr:response regulator transcription factor [Chlorobaculum sp. 24CR]
MKIISSESELAMNDYEKITQRIIIVDDDCSIRDSIAKYLNLKGWGVTIAGSAIDFYKNIDQKRFSIAIINPSLPDQNGFVLVRYLYSNTKVRIIILCEALSTESKIDGYRCGADHVLGKPLNYQELGAIVSNLMRRVEASNTCDGRNNFSVLSESKWKLIPDEWFLVTPSGKTLRLTAKEYAFISCLASQPKSIVSRTCLMQNLGYMQNECGHRSLESLVYRLRKKISPTLDTPIKTANGSGYTFTSVLELDG